MDAVANNDVRAQVASQPQAGEPVSVKPLDYEKIDIPIDIQEFGERHKIPEFSNATYRNGYVDGYRFAVASIRVASPQPANPAQVTELIADLEQAVLDFEDASSATYNRSKAELVKARAALTAAIGAGVQAVADSLWVPAKPEHKKIGWTYDFDQTERLSRAAEKATGYEGTMEVIEFVMAEADRRHKSALSQSHPADERVVEALREAADRFDEIRVILIKHLDEPERNAFWKAVNGREFCRHALDAREGR